MSERAYLVAKALKGRLLRATYKQTEDASYAADTVIRNGRPMRDDRDRGLAWSEMSRHIKRSGYRGDPKMSQHQAAPGQRVYGERKTLRGKLFGAYTMSGNRNAGAAAQLAYPIDSAHRGGWTLLLERRPLHKRPGTYLVGGAAAAAGAGGIEARRRTR